MTRSGDICSPGSMYQKFHRTIEKKNNMRITRILLVVLVAVCSVTAARSQEEAAEDRGGFRKENLFTGGSISLGFSNNSFQVGASPVLGYSLTSWVDAGIAVNWNYVSFRDRYITGSDDKIRQSTYGGGVFTRLFPVDFLFIHGQVEHNFITQKYLPAGGGSTTNNKGEATSLLLGAGYASGRYPGSGQPFFYLSILFDVLNRPFSPYTNAGGDIVPTLRAGFQIPLFQGQAYREHSR